MQGQELLKPVSTCAGSGRATFPSRQEVDFTCDAPAVATSKAPQSGTRAWGTYEDVAASCDDQTRQYAPDPTPDPEADEGEQHSHDRHWFAKYSNSASAVIIPTSLASIAYSLKKQREEDQAARKRDKDTEGQTDKSKKLVQTTTTVTHYYAEGV